MLFGGLQVILYFLSPTKCKIPLIQEIYGSSSYFLSFSHSHSQF